MIKFKNVTATYKKNVGIFNINFEVKPKELVFVMGPTGAGKSTILRAIYKDVSIDKGNIIIDKENVNECSDKKISYLRRKIGMIFQDFKLLNNRTVFENIALPLRIEGAHYADIKNKVSEALFKVGLPKTEKAFPLELSGGEQQRICIARALVKNPKIILADEPTGNLDPNVSDEILDLLESCTENGASVLMSTHNFPLIKPREKRFVELNKGRMVL
tara:strand:+ start:3675 stop:4325 length:651 start_codon:yes stop_codon:yes gene_type:complete